MSEPQTGRSGNRLAGQSSAHLQQHAHDPVDWQPWDAQALALARDSGKPILLSIGYSGCHWCDVMARESFVDAATAQLMNTLFINIKVDRDERPDLDRIYQVAHQLLTRHGGGWPLTMFLMPQDQMPFFGGSYFPLQAHDGMPAFADVLQRVAQYFTQQQPALQAQNTALRDALREADAVGSALPLEPRSLAAARQALQALFDRSNGGWGDAPKFPHASRIERLLRDWHATAFDAVPDLQALFLASLALQRMAESPLRDAQDGGFYRYCLTADWQQPEREKSVADNAALLSVYAHAARATGETLFRDTATGIAQWLVQQPDAAHSAHAALALLEAAPALGDASWLAHAEAMLRTLHGRQWRNGRLYRCNSSTSLPATLDEHATLLAALLALQTRRFDGAQLQWACTLADLLLQHFANPAEGGFFFTADDHEPLIHRSRILADDALPAGNSVAIRALQRLGGLLDEPRWINAARAALQVCLGRAVQQPLAHASLFTALEEAVHPLLYVVVRGEPAQREPWRSTLDSLYMPRVMVLHIDADASGLPAPLTACAAHDDAVAWLWQAGQPAQSFAAPALLLDALRAAQQTGS
jgi:uncharacterized protein YyaL (SSP411 family)